MKEDKPASRSGPQRLTRPPPQPLASIKMDDHIATAPPPNPSRHPCSSKR
jgi:hypothetical protein